MSVVRTQVIYIQCILFPVYVTASVHSSAIPSGYNSAQEL